jgi:hypothetical protein
MSHGTSPNFSPSTKKSPHLVPPSPQPTTTATGAAPAWSGQFVSYLSKPGTSKLTHW